MKDESAKKKKEEELETEEPTVDSEQIEVEEQPEVNEFELKYKRALADYQNLQKRVNEEKADWIKAANKELLLRFLPVLDTLILASKHVQDQGLTVSIQQFLDVLKAEGVTKIETANKAFDPHLMECIAVEDGENDKVTQEIRAGYMQYEKVLRPAQVKVGKKE